MADVHCKTVGAMVYRLRDQDAVIPTNSTSMVDHVGFAAVTAPHLVTVSMIGGCPVRQHLPE
jgi:hypothetical protein